MELVFDLSRRELSCGDFLVDMFEAKLSSCLAESEDGQRRQNCQRPPRKHLVRVDVRGKEARSAIAAEERASCPAAERHLGDRALM